MPQRFFSCFLALTTLFLPNFAAAANAQAAAVSVQPAAMLQQSLAALAGNASISDVTLTGTVRRIAGSDDDTGTVTYRALSNGAARYDFLYSYGPLSEVHGPASASPLGSWSGPDGVTHPVAFHNLANRADIFPIFALARLASDATIVVTNLGAETKNGQLVYHLSVSRQFPQMKPKSASLARHLSQTEIFLEVSTLLPVALDFNTHPDTDAGLDIPVEFLFSDYRVVSGVQIPFHVQKFLNNGLALDLQFQTGILNSGLSASLFNVQ